MTTPSVYSIISSLKVIPAVELKKDLGEVDGTLAFVFALQKYTESLDVQLNLIVLYNHY